MPCSQASLAPPWPSKPPSAPPELCRSAAECPSMLADSPGVLEVGYCSTTLSLFDVGRNRLNSSSSPSPTPAPTEHDSPTLSQLLTRSSVEGWRPPPLCPPLCIPNSPQACLLWVPHLEGKGAWPWHTERPLHYTPIHASRKEKKEGGKEGFYRAPPASRLVRRRGHSHLGFRGCTILPVRLNGNK